MDLLPVQPLLVLDYSLVSSLTDRATEAFIRMDIRKLPVAVPIGTGLLWSVLQSLPTFLSSLLKVEVIELLASDLLTVLGAVDVDCRYRLKGLATDLTVSGFRFPGLLPCVHFVSTRISTVLLVIGCYRHLLLAEFALFHDNSMMSSW